MEEEVNKVLADIRAEFGPGFSNGVIGILAHDKLPKTFGKDAWADWQFKPADVAFTKARKFGLIVGRWGKWRLTDLGFAASLRVQSELAR